MAKKTDGGGSGSSSRRASSAKKRGARATRVSLKSIDHSQLLDELIRTDRPAESADPDSLASGLTAGSPFELLDELVATARQHRETVAKVTLKLDATREAARIILAQIRWPQLDESPASPAAWNARLDVAQLTLNDQVRRVIHEQESAALKQFVDATPVRRQLPTRIDLELRAIEAVLRGTEWLTSLEVGQRQNPGATNLHAVGSRWKSERKVFFIEHRGLTLFPKYIFDELGNPLPAVAELLEIFAGYRPFRIASWFESTNSMLGGRRPREMLASDPKAVVEAARDHVVGPVHG